MADHVFGTCPMCGGEPSGGFPSTSACDVDCDAGGKQILKRWQGRYMCESCIQNEKNDIQSRNDSEKCSDGEKERARMGFEN